MDVFLPPQVMHKSCSAPSPPSPVGGVLVVVFCGLPGSGKTTLSSLLKKHVDRQVCEQSCERDCE